MNAQQLRARLREEFNEVVPKELNLTAPKSLYGCANTPVVMPKRRVFTPMRLASFCAVFLIVIFASVNTMYHHVAASISIDINPSAAIDINRFGRVINVNSYNNEAKTLLSGLNLHNRKVADALDEILASAKEKGFISDSQNNAVLFSVWSENSDNVQKYENTVQHHASKNISKLDNVRFEDVDTGSYHHAQELNQSPGKAKLVEEIVRYDGQLTSSELIDKSVGELFDVYDRCKNGQNHVGNSHDQPVKSHKNNHHGR